MADAAIAARIDSLGFLTPKHLDIKSLKGLEDKDGMWVDVVVSELGPRLEGGPVCRNERRNRDHGEGGEEKFDIYEEVHFN